MQLVGGEKQKLDAGDPRPIARKFGRVGEIAVIDLDAALGSGTNESTILELLTLARCRVGGGIRSLERAEFWLDAGAHKVILGTAARPELLVALPRNRVQAALDARHGEVVVEGWKTPTGLDLMRRIEELKPFVGGFLVTFVESEGRLEGIDMGRVREVVAQAAPLRVTVAGGVTTLEELAEIDRLGADAQVGMALYTGRFDLADALGAMLVSDRADGLWPTVVVDEREVALSLAYSDLASLRHALETGRGAYHSRKRGLWVKGETSGATQDLLAVDLDCDRDALRFTVRQHGAGACHLGTPSCWGAGRGLGELERTLRERFRMAPQGSYTKRLLEDPALLRAKLLEEAAELAEAASPEHASEEFADLLYFALVAALAKGASLAQTERKLDQRALKVTRRPGDAKP